MQETHSFTVVKTTNAKGKNAISEISIETSVKGLIYRCEVYMDSHLIDAVEVNCSDISTVDRPEEIFEARYKAAHRKFVQMYTQERSYSKVLNTEGAYSDGEGNCTVTTSIADNVYKCEAFLDGNQIDQEIEEVDKAQMADPKVFKAKYTQAHKEFAAKYIKVLKFPANTFLNPILKKFPMYKKSPMYALVFFLLTVMLILWILSLIVCGKAMKKIITSVAGKEAGMVVKDLQKSMCKKGKDGSETKLVTAADGTVSLVKTDGAKREDFTVLPQKVVFKEANQVYPIFIKNSLDSDALVRLKSRTIMDFQDPLVSADMIVNILTDKALHIKAGEVGMFEFKLENEFLQSATLEERKYEGSIVLEATNIQTKEPQSLNIGFEFVVEKAE